MTNQVTEEGVRPEVALLSEIPEDLSNVTMRFGVDLLKGFQAFDESSITPTELAYATQNFIEVANAIAVREGVPGSLIGYVIQETAVQELQLAMVAGVEAQMNAPTGPDLIEDVVSEDAVLVVEAFDPLIEGDASDGSFAVDDLNTGEPTPEATEAIDAYVADEDAIVMVGSLGELLDIEEEVDGDGNPIVIEEVGDGEEG